ncbi:MAG: YidC/Oxa1 family membrane protein insertase, partial [Lawsonibacter sp.]|nr:YidC/Oxa1 family membrane protein insertase [Lawsonibacter sp.]
MEIILKPFALLLLFFYDFLNSYGLALILFAFVIKLVLFPVSLKGKKSMIQTTMISGKMQQLQKQYGKDRERYNLEVQKLYEKEHVNPMGGCLWSVIPMVLLIALYYIIREPLINLMEVPKSMIDQVATITGVVNTGAYPQIAMAEAMNDPGILAAVKTALGDAGAKVFAMDFSFLGLNLANIPSWKFWEGGITGSSLGLAILPLVSTVVSFLSMRVSMATNKINNQVKNDQMDRTNKMMMWSMPLMSLWIGYTVPAGLSIYWIAQYL